MNQVDHAVDPALTEKVETGAIVKWGELAEALAPPPFSPPVNTKTARAVALSDDDRSALERLPEVYGSVVPSEVRKLEPSEVSSLLVERSTLKAVEKVVKKRVDDIALIVLNHSDSEYLEGSVEGTLFAADGEPLRNKDGHIVRNAKVVPDDPSLDTVFSIESRKGRPDIPPATLKEMADDPEVDYFDHDDFLAMTSPMRVFDENKAMLLLRKRPELLRALREATVSGTPVTSVYQR